MPAVVHFFSYGNSVYRVFANDFGSHLPSREVLQTLDA